MRTEKDFLNTLETYVKITHDRLRDGRIIDTHDELQLIETMIGQRLQEIAGKAKWLTPERQTANELGEEMLSRPRTKETLEALKEHPWKSHHSLGEMIERQAEGGEDDPENI